MRRKTKVVPVDLAQVIVDSSDGTKDYWIKRSDAQQLYNDGVLSINLDNSKQGCPVYMDEGEKFKHLTVK